MEYLNTDILTRKDKIFLTVYTFFAAFILFPLLSDYFPLDSQTVDIFVFLMCVILYPNAYKNKLMGWALCYFGILTLFFLFGADITIGIGKATVSKKLLIEIAWTLPSFSIVSILWYRNNLKVYNYVALISVAVYLISFVSVLPIVMHYDMRLLATQAELDIHVLGLPGYTLMHAFAMSLPVAFMGYISAEGKHKLVALVLLICNIILVLNTNVTTSLVAMLICIIFFLSYGKKSGINFFRLVILMVCVLIIYSFNVVEHFLEFLCGWFEGTAVQPKMESFLALYRGGEDEIGAVTGRENLHAISMDSFLSNMIWGGDQVGGHSVILDRLGGMGLLAGIPFIMLLISQIIVWKKKFCNHLSRSYYYLGICIATVFLYTKGLFGEEGWFMISIFVPVVIYTCSMYTVKQSS